MEGQQGEYMMRHKCTGEQVKAWFYEQVSELMSWVSDETNLILQKHTNLFVVIHVYSLAYWYTDRYNNMTVFNKNK